jgi:Uma2 family endonuclease
MSTRAQNRPAASPSPQLHWSERTDLTLDDIEALVQANAFTEYDRLELIDGKLVPMAAKGRRHEVVREELADWLTRNAPTDVFVTSEPQLNLADKLFRLPDILLRPRSIKTPFVRGPDTLLVIEVADTSLPSDIKTKSAIYAAHGVREYWVINAATLMTTVHLAPSASGYGSINEVASNQKLVPALVPALLVQLDQLDI